MKYDVPQIGIIDINTIILDLNGTLAVHGKIVKGAKNRITKLIKLGFKIVLFSVDQRGSLSKLCNNLKIDFKKVSSGEEKERFFFHNKILLYISQSAIILIVQLY